MQYRARLFAAALTVAAAASPVLAQTSVTTLQGQVEGTLAAGSRAWLGIPFAQPPVGDLRWKPPVAAPAWSGVRKADHFAASCQQAVGPGGFGAWTQEYVVSGAVSEDCLYLNVWAPAKPGKKLPVLVWIYGGGFSSGSGSVPIYNGAALAAKGVIVVNMNYRVGIYGFFAHPDLDKENPQGASGNYGLMDQIAALKWVKANIAAFGGDPGNVTIAGQSAGAASVHHLINSPLASGLFVRAIAQSGSGMGLDVASHADADKAGLAFAQAAGAADIAALRAMTPEQLAATAAKTGRGGLNFSPVIDGAVLPDAATALGGNANDVPVLTGLTADENSAFSFGPPQAVTPQSLNAGIERSYGADADAFKALYAATDAATASAAKSDLARDRGIASLYVWAAKRETHSQAPIYAYLWTHVEPGPDAAKYGAFHSSEIPYVFGTLDTAKRPFTAADYSLSEQAGRYWLNFVRTGDPNGPGLPHWPQLKPVDRLILNIGGDTHVQPLLPPAKLEAFSQYVAHGGTLSLFSF